MNSKSNLFIGFTNTLSCGCGFIAPLVAGFLLENVADKFLAWNVLFYICMGIYLIGKRSELNQLIQLIGPIWLLDF